jgi:YVTN family beta-propeller protein
VKQRHCVISVICFLALAVPGPCQNAMSVVPPNLVFELLALDGDLETAAKPKYLSPTAIAPSPDTDRTFLYITEQTAKQIAVVDRRTGAVVKTMQLPNEPTGIAVSQDGSYLYVTCASERWPSGMVCIVNTAGGTVEKRIPVGHMARAPVLSPDGKTLYVCNRFNNSVSVVDVASGTESARIPVTREPYASALTPDGNTLIITNALPDQKATDTLSIACKITLINTQSRTVAGSIPLPVGSHSLFGLCVSPDGAYAFVTHLMARFTIPALTITNGWVHSNNLAIVDIAHRTLVNDIELDNMNRGMANPWGLSCTADGKFLCVLHAGSNEMTVIDLPQLLAKAVGAADLSHDFTSILSIKNIIPLAAGSPRSIAFVNNTAYVAGYFSDTMDVVAINSLTDAGVSRLILGPVKAMTSERRGEYAFCDASICMQQWQSCQSCHPFTRPDALNWILNSEVAAPKNAKSMLYTFQTPPTSWAGKRPGAGGPDGSVRAGIRTELFTEPNEAAAVAIDSFLMRLKPVPSPRLVKGRLSESAQRGKSCYTKVGCQFCHPAPLYTDMRFHNAGVADPFDANTSWDTPSIIESWRTGPWGHLGSYDKLEDLILLGGHSMDASKLTPQEFQDLMEYILSL